MAGGGGGDGWQQQSQRRCMCVGHCSKEATFSYPFNPHHQPYAVGTITPILKVKQPKLREGK